MLEGNGVFESFIAILPDPSLPRARRDADLDAIGFGRDARALRIAVGRGKGA